MEVGTKEKERQKDIYTQLFIASTTKELPIEIFNF